MLLGTAKACITPPLGTWMAGYGFRTKPCESISEDLYIRVHVHRFEDGQIVYIYADLAHWDNLVVRDARRLLQERYGLQSGELVFMASHTHCGPMVGHDSLEVQEDVNYTAHVLSQIVSAVGEALRDLTPVHMTRYNGRCLQNVYRRVWENGQVLMMPNYEIPADRNLTVLVLRDDAGQVRGILLHYPCHANLAKGYSIHGDYPGAALRMLDERYPSSIALFMQGCTGDLRPNSVCGDEFVPASYEEVVGFASRFLQCCERAMAGAGLPVEERLSVSERCFDLPLEGLRDEQTLREMAENERGVPQLWAQKVLERGNHPYETLELRRISYGKGLVLYTYNAEVVQSYAAYARLLEPEAVSVGYTNGMIGYLSNAQQIVEGGYEPRDSATYFALAGTYTMEIDRIIRAGLRELSGKNENQ